MARMLIPKEQGIQYLQSLYGLVYVDIKLLHPHHVGRTADGRRYIRINRKMSIVDTVFSVDTRFCLQSKGVSRIRQWVGSFMEAFGSDGVVVTVR